MERTLALADYLEEGGSVKSFNVDNLLLRESMDVIGAPLCPPQWSPACSWDQDACKQQNSVRRLAEQGDAWAAQPLIAPIR